MIKYINKILDNVPGIREYREGQKAIKETGKLKKQLEFKDTLLGMFRHEASTYLNPLVGFSDILAEMDGLKPEEIEMYSKIINYSAHSLNNFSSFATLEDMTLDSFKKKSGEVNFYKNLSFQAGSQDDFLKNNKLKLNIFYTDPLDIFTNPGAICLATSTLLGNSENSALPGTTINQGARIDSGNLEFLIENSHNGKKIRNASGLGEGRGLDWVKDVVNVLQGTFEQYEGSQIDPAIYEYQDSFGDLSVKDVSEDIFGVKLTIPMENLTRSTPAHFPKAKSS